MPAEKDDGKLHAVGPTVPSGATRKQELRFDAGRRDSAKAILGFQFKYEPFISSIAER